MTRLLLDCTITLHFKNIDIEKKANIEAAELVKHNVCTIFFQIYIQLNEPGTHLTTAHNFEY